MRGHLDVKDLEKYKKPDLQALARDLGVSDEGTIKEIAARCAAVEVEIPDDDQQEPGAIPEGQDQGENQGAAPEGNDQGQGAAPEGQDQGENQGTAPDGDGQDQGAAPDGVVMVKVVESYYDLELERIVKKDEVLPMKEERAAVIIGKELGEKVEE